MLTSGTATGHNDLVTQLHDWLVNTVGWTQMAYTPHASPPADTDHVSVVLRAPGATSGNEYFLYLDTQADVGNNKYSVKMRAAIDYDSTILIGSQNGISPEVYFNLWNHSIDYWFYATPRRVIVVAKVNTSYISMYAGLFLPFALPSQYPKPFVIMGNYGLADVYDTNNTGNRFLADPGAASAYYLNRAATGWNGIANHANTGTTDVNFISGAAATMWPHRSIRNTTSKDTAGAPATWNYSGILRMRPLVGGKVPLFICHIMSYAESKVVGALDGVYSIPGVGRTSEQLMSFGSPAQEFRAFQNIFRTTGRDYMAIEEI